MKRNCRIALLPSVVPFDILKSVVFIFIRYMHNNSVWFSSYALNGTLDVDPDVFSVVCVFSLDSG